ncbi:hypothetical protein BDW75DRAFT_235150 [Aspergillus navahoensis]
MVHLRHAGSDFEAGNGRSRRHYTCMVLIFIRVCIPDSSLFGLGLLPLFVHGNTPAFFYAFSRSRRHFSKPRGIEIVALVPFHEPSRTEILACYLSRYLASSGGFLVRVVVMPQTNHTESLEWLSSMVDGTSSYKVSERGYLAYELVDENVSTLFVWIDGDVVFLEHHTIATISRTNHSSIALPYLPELHPAKSVDSNSWRASELPRWKEPTGFQALPFLWTNLTDSIKTSFFCMGGDGKHIPVADVLQDTAFRPSGHGSHMAKDLIIDGKGVVAAHYFSGHGSKGLEETDVLQRYRSYAREMGCPWAT